MCSWLWCEISFLALNEIIVERVHKYSQWQQSFPSSGARRRNPRNFPGGLDFQELPRWREFEWLKVSLNQGQKWRPQAVAGLGSVMKLKVAKRLSKAETSTRMDRNFSPAISTACSLSLVKWVAVFKSSYIRLPCRRQTSQICSNPVELSWANLIVSNLIKRAFGCGAIDTQRGLAQICCYLLLKETRQTILNASRGCITAWCTRTWASSDKRRLKSLSSFGNGINLGDGAWLPITTISTLMLRALRDHDGKVLLLAPITVLCAFYGWNFEDLSRLRLLLQVPPTSSLLVKIRF